MIRLRKADYKNAEPYLTEAPAFVDAVLHHIIPGFVYADGSETFLIGADSGIFHVAGEETGNHAWIDQLYREREASGMRFTLSSSSAKWEKRIEDIFGERVTSVPRYAFTYTKQEAGVHPYPEGYTLKKIDGEAIRMSKEFPPSYYE